MFRESNIKAPNGGLTLFVVV